MAIQFSPIHKQILSLYKQRDTAITLRKAAVLQKTVKTFAEIHALAVFIIRHLGDRKEGRKLLKEAEARTQTYFEQIQLADAVLNALHDLTWGKRLIAQTTTAVKHEASETICILAEVISHPDGLNDQKGARELFKTALALADDRKQRLSIADSIENSLEDQTWSDKIVATAGPKIRQ
jgi:hypothetical protein